MSDEQKIPLDEVGLDASSGLYAYRFDHTGIRRVLGPLEADVLETVWQLTSGDDAALAGWRRLVIGCAG